MTSADYGLPPVDVEHLPASVKPPPAPDYSSFEAYQRSQRRDAGVAFPEAELRQLFTANPDGTVLGKLIETTLPDPREVPINKSLRGFTINGRRSKPLGEKGSPETIRITRDNFKEFLQ